MVKSIIPDFKLIYSTNHNNHKKLQLSCNVQSRKSHNSANINETNNSGKQSRDSHSIQTVMGHGSFKGSTYMSIHEHKIFLNPYLIIISTYFILIFLVKLVRAAWLLRCILLICTAIAVLRVVIKKAGMKKYRTIQ